MSLLMTFGAVVACGVMLIVIHFLYRKRTDKEKSGQDRIKKELDDIWSQIRSIMEEIEEDTDIQEQLRLCDELLSVIEEAMEHPLASTIMPDLREAEADARAIKRTRLIQEFLELADREKLKGHMEDELEFLLNAIDEAKKQGTTDDDFKMLGIMLEKTGRPVTLADIEKRARELGWEGA
jgi:hypothetical protein